MLPFFMRHYQSWIDRFVIFDDGSTDGSIEYLASFKNVEVRRFEREFEDSLVESHRFLYDTCWQESTGKADWVVVTNLDEHLFHPTPLKYLYDCKKNGVTAVPGLGFQMITDLFPRENQHLAHDVKLGMPWPQMSKLSLFDPNAISATNYAVGRHTAQPEGNAVYPAKDELLNLHFKYLGLDYLTERSRELKSGLQSVDIANKWGHRYLWDRNRIEVDFQLVKREAVDISQFCTFDLAMHSWWRKKDQADVHNKKG